MTTNTSNQTLAWFVANKTNNNTQKDVKASGALAGVDPVQGKLSDIDVTSETTKKVAKAIMAKKRRGLASGFVAKLNEAIAYTAESKAEEVQGKAKAAPAHASHGYRDEY